MKDDSNSVPERLGEFAAHIETMRDAMSIVQTELKSMNVTLAVNTRQLELHIEGVRLAREQNAILRDEFDLREKEVNARLLPIEDNFKFVSKFSRLVIWAAAIPAVVFYVIQIIHSIRG